MPPFGASPNAFWLDSARRRTRARFSFMGDATGTARRCRHLRRGRGRCASRGAARSRPPSESIFDYLDAELRPAAPGLRGAAFRLRLRLRRLPRLRAEGRVRGDDAHRRPTPRRGLPLRRPLWSPSITTSGRTYLLCARPSDGGTRRAMDRRRAALASLAAARRVRSKRRRGEPVESRCLASRERYLADIASLQARD